MSSVRHPKEVLVALSTGERLNAEQAGDVFAEILSGNWGEAEIASLLTALRIRGETVDELVGAAAALRANLVSLDPPIPGMLDTCGTGGDQSGTFNISTAVAIVAAACGVSVAKHGNRSASSKTGSADVLKQLGCNIDMDRVDVVKCLREIGLAFFFAPHWHSAMRHVGPVRGRLGFRTIFNLIGPLCNPAGAEHQLIGIGRFGSAPTAASDIQQIVAQAVARLGTVSSIVVSGKDGLDEVTLADETRVFRIARGEVLETAWTHADFGLPKSHVELLRVDNPDESAAVIRGLLNGVKGPHRDYALANTAAALLAAEKIADLKDGVALAATAIDSGAAAGKLEDLVTRSRDSAKES